MNVNPFRAALLRRNESRPPVWLMRQAGRYHSHYQNLRKHYSFMELCKQPDLSCEVALGPIQDFGFDAAILFSDILFPLEAMGMGLSFNDKPQLDWYLRDLSDLKKLKSGSQLAEGLLFQARAIELLRQKLSPEKAIIGFVGGPLTLFFYAVEGCHQGELASAKKGLTDGRFDGFCELLMDLLVQAMVNQARAGADAIAILDTCAGEVDPSTYKDRVLPYLGAVIKNFKEKCPNHSLIYYSKGTTPAYFQHLSGLPIDCLGVDWKQDLCQLLKTWPDSWNDAWSIQGNIDPNWLLLDENQLELKLRNYFGEIGNLPPALLKGWVCGLGHGILPKTPEKNVRLLMALQKEYFGKRTHSEC